MFLSVFIVVVTLSLVSCPRMLRYHRSPRTQPRRFLAEQAPHQPCQHSHPCYEHQHAQHIDAHLRPRNQKNRRNHTYTHKQHHEPHRRWRRVIIRRTAAAEQPAMSAPELPRPPLPVPRNHHHVLHPLQLLVATVVVSPLVLREILLQVLLVNEDARRVVLHVDNLHLVRHGYRALLLRRNHAARPA